MHIKENFKLMKVGIQNIVAATGDDEEKFNGMIRLNSTGAFLWEKTVNEISKNELIKALMDEYEIDEEKAVKGVDSFLESLRKEGILEE